MHDEPSSLNVSPSSFGAPSDLFARPVAKLQVCTDLGCLQAGSESLLSKAKASGLPVEACSCLGACDRAPAIAREQLVLPSVTEADLERAQGDWQGLRAAANEEDEQWLGLIGCGDLEPDQLGIHLAGEMDFSGSAFARAQEIGADEVLKCLEQSGLQGRGGAGYPVHQKWTAVRRQQESTRYVVLNGAEGEPGSFKDRETLARRPDRVLEGLAIAAFATGAKEVHVAIRSEFQIQRKIVERALSTFVEQGTFGDIEFHMAEARGGYVGGEETALLEGIQGRPPKPRMKPPYPTEWGLRGKPTLVQNVETIAYVPAILQRGGEWFQGLGRAEAGTKLYSLSGHVARPGVYELPLGVTLDELVEAAGGYVGELKAFSAGGTASGFLPATERSRPLDYKSMSEARTFLGCGAVSVLNTETDMRWAVLHAQRFFAKESCGQCGPCKMGTSYLYSSMAKLAQGEPGAMEAFAQMTPLAGQMHQATACGLGSTAPLPVMSGLAHFPDELK